MTQIQVPKNRSKLMFAHECWLYTTHKMPDPFRRFWQWFLLGWKWEKVE